MATTRKCENCGKEITSGYVFDGDLCFCSSECITEFFDCDEGCTDILIDEGERIIWYDNNLPTPPHYKVNIGCERAEDFHYCDTWQKLCNWLSERLNRKIETHHDIYEYNQDHKTRRIEIIVFNPKEYYENRRLYVEQVRLCEDTMNKARLSWQNKKRKRFLRYFSIHYNNANELWDMYPEVWQGEI